MGLKYEERRTKLPLLWVSLAAARSRVTALESPEALLALIRSGDPEMRLKLKAEIRKRISRIEVSFGLDGFEAVADVKFINGGSSSTGNGCSFCTWRATSNRLSPPRPGPAWASNAYMLRLQAVYAESLASGSEVSHDQLHEDNRAYDF